MKTFRNVVKGLGVVLGIMFLLNSATDIQLGFGITLLVFSLGTLE